MQYLLVRNKFHLHIRTYLGCLVSKIALKLIIKGFVELINYDWERLTTSSSCEQPSTKACSPGIDNIWLLYKFGFWWKLPSSFFSRVFCQKKVFRGSLIWRTQIIIYSRVYYYLGLPSRASRDASAIFNQGGAIKEGWACLTGSQVNRLARPENRCR